MARTTSGVPATAPEDEPHRRGRDGTGPDDSPLLRSLRDESRKEGWEEGRAKTVHQILRSRGLALSTGFPADAPGFAESPEDEAVALALACDGEADFRKRIRKP